MTWRGVVGRCGNAPNDQFEQDGIKICRARASAFPGGLRIGWRCEAGAEETAQDDRRATNPRQQMDRACILRVVLPSLKLRHGAPTGP